MIFFIIIEWIIKYCQIMIVSHNLIKISNFEILGVSYLLEYQYQYQYQYYLTIFNNPLNYDKNIIFTEINYSFEDYVQSP